MREGDTHLHVSWGSDCTFGLGVWEEQHRIQGEERQHVHCNTIWNTSLCSMNNKSLGRTGYEASQSTWCKRYVTWGLYSYPGHMKAPGYKART